jgi:hypothetical protein
MRRQALCLLFAVAGVGGPPAEELAPLSTGGLEGPGGARAGMFSRRTLSLALELDRDGSRLLAYTLKDRPFIKSLSLSAPRGREGGRLTQLEVALIGPRNERLTQRFEVGPLCLLDSALAEPHVEGDTITLHRESFVVEEPEVAGFDRIEIAAYESEGAGLARRMLALETLDAGRFTPAGGAARYSDLAFARPVGQAESSAPLTTGAVLWPESFGDPDIYRLVGNAAEAGRRISVAVVPDGYTYAEKALMISHFDTMVATLRSRTPLKEHDSFINYTLIFAYSRDSGPDQCDCSVISDTAMSTRFPTQVATCGDPDNRCLYYGGGCDTDSSAHIADAELRAPVFSYSEGDRTLVMVNTPRYGGCAGLRAVFSAAHSAAPDVALHELGHALGGLADEYQGTPACGVSASEINTSRNAVSGAWPEWIAQLGAPRQGAETYDSCVYRPQADCEMRTLIQPFCAVCNQRWALVVFGSPRINVTAPITSWSPYTEVTTLAGARNDFSVLLRLASGAGVSNDITWQIQGPGYPTPTIVASGTAAYSRSFDSAGSYTLTCTVVADTNFVKPLRNGPNVDAVTWNVQVYLPLLPAEVSPPGVAQPLAFADLATLVWEPAWISRSDTFNLYRGPITDLPSGSNGLCYKAGLLTNSMTELAAPSSGSSWFYLVTGKNAAGEGPMGTTSDGLPRATTTPCP